MQSRANYTKAMLAFGFCILLASCSTLTKRETSGRDFDETKVGQIKKGSTTSGEIVGLYGEPDRKEILSAKEVMWHYTYLTLEYQTHSGMFIPMVEKTTGYKKNLDILLQDDVVANYTYVKVPIVSEKEISGSVITN